MEQLTSKQARNVAKYIRDHWDPRWRTETRIEDGFD